jgi:hypothetical protein
VDLARTGNRTRRGFGQFRGLAQQFGGERIHRFGLGFCWKVHTKMCGLLRRVRGQKRDTESARCDFREAPYAGVNRIRFEGTLSAVAGTPASTRH